MTDRTRLHHVVFAVEAQNQDAAAALWRGLGFDFADIDLSDIGLRVLLDWSGGVEIISPAGPGAEGEVVQSFLDSHGEGVYSVVVRTNDMDGALDVARRFGVAVALRQNRDGEGFRLDEARLEPHLGMGITLLETDLPD